MVQHELLISLSVRLISLSVCRSACLICMILRRLCLTKPFSVCCLSVLTHLYVCQTHVSAYLWHYFSVHYTPLPLKSPLIFTRRFYHDPNQPLKNSDRPVFLHRLKVGAEKSVVQRQSKPTPAPADICCHLKICLTSVACTIINIIIMHAD
jgi:hypothetical protein